MRAAALALVAAAGLGCASDRAVAAQLAAAAQPGHLPGVVACWEKAVEAGGLQGEHTATVDFVVEGGTGRLREAKVRAIEPAEGGGAEAAPAALSACVEAALGASALPREADREGPGFAASRDVAVRGYRIAFADAREGRERASEKQAHVLIGPRTDRCQGLYTHDPPRDASALFAEIAEVEGRAASLRGSDRDAYARELQKLYDAQLELRERLRLDAAEPGLPPANRERVLAAREGADRAARATAARIRCEAPPAP